MQFKSDCESRLALIQGIACACKARKENTDENMIEFWDSEIQKSKDKLSKLD